MKKDFGLSAIQNISKNLDFSLRLKGSKTVAVVSDRTREGKSAFIVHCLPVFCDLYKRKVLVFDFQPEKNDFLEKNMAISGAGCKFVRNTSVNGLDYVHVNDLSFLNSLSNSEREREINSYYQELSSGYDIVFVNTKTLKQAGNTNLTVLPIDGAVLVRSNKTLGNKKLPITTEIMDRDIPILGIVMNEGV